MMLMDVLVAGQSSKVWVGGEGEPVLLVHGGWGGAEMHWMSVWLRLADKYHVIAPELPGVGDHRLPALPSIGAYADWIVQLLDSLGIGHAWCVGNSFGAAVAWDLASRLGPRCKGVVLVNGMPFEMPRIISRISSLAPIRRLLRNRYLKLAFNPSALQSAFADPERAPTELKRVLLEPPPAQVDALLGIALSGARSEPAPTVPLLIVWGEADLLPGTSCMTALNLKRRVAGARLIFIPDAGHCPQVEQPGKFMEALTSFIA